MRPEKEPPKEAAHQLHAAGVNRHARLTSVVHRWRCAAEGRAERGRTGAGPQGARRLQRGSPSHRPATVCKHKLRGQRKTGKLILPRCLTDSFLLSHTKHKLRSRLWCHTQKFRLTGWFPGAPFRPLPIRKRFRHWQLKQNLHRTWRVPGSQGRPRRGRTSSCGAERGPRRGHRGAAARGLARRHPQVHSLGLKTEQHMCVKDAPNNVLVNNTETRLNVIASYLLPSGRQRWKAEAEEPGRTVCEAWPAKPKFVRFRAELKTVISLLGADREVNFSHFVL